MGTLIHTITALSGARYGVNILEQSPPGGVRAAGSNVVAVVGHFPWGPVDTPTEITSNAELFDQFAPTPFDVLDDWAALKAFINKAFPNTVLVVRISPSAGAAASRTFDDASSGDSVTVTANYKGSVGNSLKVSWAANADDATARDATVSIGTLYSRTYKQVATIVASALVVTDPGDPYVTFSKASGATLVPAAIAATALASGADGTPDAGDYTTAMDTLADASVDFHVAFVAEPSSALIDAINDGIKSFVDANAKGVWVPCTPASQTPTSAATYAADYRSDRIHYAAPKVTTINAFDADRAEITVDGNAFRAAMIANVDPEISPGGASGAPFARGITGLEAGWSATPTQLATLNAAGVSPWFIDRQLGAIAHRAVTTSLTAGFTKLFRRRMTDYIMESIADYLAAFVEKPLDLDLTNRRLGSITGPEMGGLRAFLDGLLREERIRGYEVDEFGGNVQANIDDGQWIILVSVQLVSMQEEIVLKASIGESVQITQLTA